MTFTTENIYFIYNIGHIFCHTSSDFWGLSFMNHIQPSPRPSIPVSSTPYDGRPTRGPMGDVVRCGLTDSLKNMYFYSFSFMIAGVSVVWQLLQGKRAIHREGGQGRVKCWICLVGLQVLSSVLHRNSWSVLLSCRTMHQCHIVSTAVTDVSFGSSQIALERYTETFWISNYIKLFFFLTKPVKMWFWLLSQKAWSAD